jgi:hypothetical protein
MQCRAEADRMRMALTARNAAASTNQRWYDNPDASEAWEPAPGWEDYEVTGWEFNSPVWPRHTAAERIQTQESQPPSHPPPVDGPPLANSYTSSPYPDPRAGEVTAAATLEFQHILENHDGPESKWHAGLGNGQEWELAQWALSGGLSLSKLDELLRIDMVRYPPTYLS